MFVGAWCLVSFIRPTGAQRLGQTGHGSVRNRIPCPRRGQTQAESDSPAPASQRVGTALRLRLRCTLRWKRCGMPLVPPPPGPSSLSLSLSLSPLILHFPSASTSSLSQSALTSSGLAGSLAPRDPPRPRSKAAPLATPRDPAQVTTPRSLCGRAAAQARPARLGHYCARLSGSD